MAIKYRFKGFLFDLDGTLLDTAPDLLLALNHVLRKNNKPNLKLENIRSIISEGSEGLIQLGLGFKKNSPAFNVAKKEFLNYYRDNLTENTSIFGGMEEILAEIEDSGRQWGIVTNKPTCFTMPLLEYFGWTNRTRCIICGDSLRKRKPSPEPLIEGSKRLKLSVKECVYVGDALSDIEASRAAGMLVITAKYGYLPDGDVQKNWKTNNTIDNPSDLRSWLK